MNDFTSETKLRRRTRVILNLLIIGFGGLLAILLLQTFVSQPNRAIQVGDTLNVKSLGAESKGRLLVFLKSDCVYCTKDAAFYRSLFTELKESNSFKFVPVFSRNDLRTKAYLSELGLGDAEYSFDSFSDLGVTGTPIIAITDPMGRVERLWRGSLSHKQETEIKLVLGFETSSLIISESKLKDFMDQKREIAIVDVRSKDLYSSESVKGAKNIPLDELAIRGVNEIPESATVVVYGSTEKDGEDALEILSESGYSNVLILVRGSQ